MIDNHSCYLCVPILLILAFSVTPPPPFLSLPPYPSLSLSFITILREHDNLRYNFDYPVDSKTFHDSFIFFKTLNSFILSNNNHKMIDNFQYLLFNVQSSLLIFYNTYTLTFHPSRACFLSQT